jgi:hypothetical protein
VIASVRTMPCNTCKKEVRLKKLDAEDVCQLNQEKLDAKDPFGGFRVEKRDKRVLCLTCRHDYGSHTSGAPDAKQGGGGVQGKLVCCGLLILVSFSVSCVRV